MRHELAGDLETVLLKALEKELEHRYATVDELAADLRRFRRHEPIAARRPGLGHQLRLRTVESSSVRSVETQSMLRSGIFAVLLLTNAVAVFCAVNPWFEDWRSKGVVVLAAEAFLALAIGVPVFVHFRVRWKKPIRECLEETARTMLDLLAGWA